jgi:glyoxylase-like metal-dependent hydrolase (beta-lactamase superfamily II)
MLTQSLPRRSGNGAKARALATGVVGALIVTAAPLLRAQSGAAPDFSNVEIHSLHVQGNVWMLVGGPFNAAVSIGNDGVLVVDTMVEPLADRLLAEVKKLAGDKPIRYIINTHFHPDHTGGNAKVTRAGQSIVAGNFAAQVGQDAANQANVIAHENTQLRMMSDLKPPPPFVAMPTDTFFTEAKDLYFNGEAVQILHQPAAHTDGDVIVHFRKSDVIVAGDVYINTTFPIVQVDQGGSFQGVIDALNRIIDITVPAEKQEGGTYVIPGHGRLADEADVVEYRDMSTIIRDRFLDAIKKGLTLEQVKGARLLRDYEGRYGASSGFWTTDNFVEAVYRSLSEPPKKSTQVR